MGHEKKPSYHRAPSGTWIPTIDSDAQDVILDLVPVDIHFGLKRNDGNTETPWRDSLTIYPSPEFVRDMNRLHEIRNTKQVRFMTFNHREISSLSYSDWKKFRRKVGPREKIIGRKNTSTRSGISYSSNFDQ